MDKDKTFFEGARDLGNIQIDFSNSCNIRTPGQTFVKYVKLQ